MKVDAVEANSHSDTSLDLAPRLCFRPAFQAGTV